MKHGGDLTEAIARYGGTHEMWMDLSTGINPNPWPVATDLLTSSLYQLPSRADEIALINAARIAYRAPQGADLIAASGTQALIQWLPRLARRGKVAIVAPTYSEHARAWSSSGQPVVTCDALEHLPEDIRHAIVVNPNNPDGRMVTVEAMAHAAKRLQAQGGWLVIDEAFIDLSPDMTAAVLCADLPVIVLRSFGKFYGLAGVRLGIAIAHQETANLIRDALGPWAVSGPALTIGAAALQDDAWATATRQGLQSAAARLDIVLQAAGCTIIGGTGLFRLVRHHDAPELHERLARHHIWCRSFDWAADLLRFGLPKDDAAFSRLADALR